MRSHHTGDRDRRSPGAPGEPGCDPPSSRALSQPRSAVDCICEGCWALRAGEAHLAPVGHRTLWLEGFALPEDVWASFGVPIGLAFAWLYRRADRRAWIPLAVAAAMVAVFAIGPFFGLPLIGRYIRTPAMLLALFYGAAVFGYRMLAGRDRARWKVIGVVAALLSIAYLPWHVSMLSDLEDRFDRDGRLYAQLEDAATAPAVRAAFERCAPLSTADHRPIPYVRDWLDGDPGSVGTVAQGASPLGRLHLVPRATALPRRFYRKNFPPDVGAPPGYTTLYENASWRVYAAPGCS